MAVAAGAWIVFEDESGQSLRPPKARTWSRRGHTPVVTVNGAGGGRVSAAGLIAVRPGRRTRLFYRLVVYHGRKGEPKGLREDDYIALLHAAHHQLGAPIVLFWDNLNTHHSAAMQAFLDRNDWLTVIRLPAYAPELNPVEGLWSQVKRQLANLIPSTVDQLAAQVRTLLKRAQYRPGLLDGFIAETGLTLDTNPQCP